MSDTEVSMWLFGVNTTSADTGVVNQAQYTERVIQKVQADGNLEITALLEMEADELDDVAIKGGKSYINVV